jgi:hypothetical protein
VSSQNFTMIALVGIPVLAALCLGMLVRALEAEREARLAEAEAEHYTY